MINILWLLVALALVFLNAFFVAAEFSMVKLRATKIKEIQSIYGKRGSILAYIHSHLDSYLSACQLGITLASLGLGWIGEPAFARLLEAPLHWLGIDSPELIAFIAFLVAFVIISFLHIVVGELMPKSLAIRQSEKVSVWTAVPLYLFYWLMYPGIWFLNACANYLLRLFHLDRVHQSEDYHSTEEIKLILTASHLHGELSQEETDIIEHTLDLADLKVTEVMRPCDEMVMLTLQDNTSDLLQKVLATRFSRYPIYNQDTREMVGIIHVKDLFSALYQQQNIKDILPLVRPVLKVSERLPALELLRKFREGMPHFALVYQGNVLTGFVTLDNLLHVLIGRVKDEFHKTKDDWFPNGDGSFTVKGECSIYSLEQALQRDMDIAPTVELDTVAELILHRLGAYPKPGVRVELLEFFATIEKMDGKHIQRLRVWPKVEPSEDIEDI